LLEEGRTLAALRYILQHKVGSVPPAAFLEAAAAGGDPVAYAAVFRFFAENVRDFTMAADYSNFTRQLQQDGDISAPAGASSMSLSPNS
jgi:hypothetical protein